MKLYPLKFTPIPHYRIWGGTKLNTAVPRELQMENLGEIWSISGVEGNVSSVENGELKGKSITELLKEYKEKLVGEKIWDRFGENFPLLIKFLDAETNLSVQVHPNDEQAKILHNSFGKSEMWYIMEAEPTSELIIGFKEGIKKENYLKHLSSETLEEILNKIPVQKGDAVYIPAGRVHAIGSGIILAEIQQTSDITYRIYDYKRIDKDGKKRELHTAQAAEVIDFSAIEEIKTSYQTIENDFSTLIETPFFHTQIYSGKGCLEFSGNQEMLIYLCLEGEVEIKYAQSKIELKKYQSILIPADCSDYEFHSDSGVQLLKVSIP